MEDGDAMDFDDDDDERTLMVDEASMDASKDARDEEEEEEREKEEREKEEGEKMEVNVEGKKDGGDETKKDDYDPNHDEIYDEDGDGFIRSDVPRGMSRWRRAVADCSSASQLYICINMVDRSVAWDKSIMKAVSRHPFFFFLC